MNLQTQVTLGVDALLQLASAAPSQRAAGHALTPLEERVYEWLRYLEPGAGQVQEASADERTRLRVMRHQLIVLCAAAELTALSRQGPARRLVTVSGQRCCVQLGFHACRFELTLQPQQHPAAYSLGFWPNSPVCEPDLIERYLQGVDSPDASVAFERLDAALRARYR